MEAGLLKLYAGDFNTRIDRPQKDGSIIITLAKNGERKTYRFKVRDLYGPNEEVLEHEVIEIGGGEE